MDLDVIGSRAFFFDDDATAAFVNSDDALVEWNSISIDRYDVRHLLSSPLPLRRGRKSNQGCHSLSPPQPPLDHSFEAELDQERYLDLPLQPDEQDVVDNGVRREDSDAYRAVGFSYGNSHDSVEQKDVNAAEFGYPGFCPPFPVPESLLQNLPPTEKVHQIIARTAIFVRKHGGQTEIVLRVKHGDNPTFGFLMPHHHLHAYFRFLVDNKDILKLDADGKPNGDSDTPRGGGALSLLGSVYGSGEDEDAPGFIETQSLDNSDALKSNSDALKSAIPNGSEQTCISESSCVKPLPSNEKKAPLSRDHTDVAVKTVGFPVASATKNETPVLEPPADTKIVIDKIVEFILRNGRDFETVLMEQDSKHGRFPFLLASNPYHSFYLKALQKSHQTGDPSASMSRYDHDMISHDPDKKEKFKMVIPKSKKDSDRPSKSCDPQFSVDAASAAAIVQAATRGIKNPSLGFLPKEKSSIGNGDSSSPIDEAHSSECCVTKEQKLKAERLKRAKMFAAMIKSGAETGKTKNSSALRVNGFDKTERRSNRKYRSRSFREDEEDEEDLGKRSKKKRKHHHGRRHHKQQGGDSCSSDETGMKQRSKKNFVRGRESELEEGEIHSKLWAHSPDVPSSREVAEVPEDLRAKVRAMLATL